MQADQQRGQADHQFRQWQETQQIEFQKWKVQFEAQMQLQIEQMKLAAERELKIADLSVRSESDGKRIEVLQGLKAGMPYASSGSFVVKSELGKGSAEHTH
jgi:hypothetical protein